MSRRQNFVPGTRFFMKIERSHDGICPRDMSLQHVPSCEPTLKERLRGQGTLTKPHPGSLLQQGEQAGCLNQSDNFLSRIEHGRSIGCERGRRRVGMLIILSIPHLITYAFIWLGECTFVNMIRTFEDFRLEAMRNQVGKEVGKVRVGGQIPLFNWNPQLKP